ncbi:MAG: hypothetical protein U9R27_09965 [Campylobacterota bacterium]|nr:hypothetical protein [Campylobacterota bacterium]
MKLFDYFQSHPPEITHYTPRKLQLPDENHINLHGVRGAGKSMLVVDYLEEMDHETLLYIDGDDPNLLFGSIDRDELQSYIWESSIELLVLDHYEPSILEEIPHAERIIILSRTPLSLAGFAEVELFPLDYEEFLAFERSTSAANSFNHFLKLGTLPVTSRSTQTATIELKTFLQSRFERQEQQLLALLAIYQTKHLTTHQIYRAAKERFKVSKDWLYRKIKDFQQEGILYFIEDIHQKGGKKLIIFDFALGKYLTMGQPFITQFDSIIALALIKHHRAFKTLGIHGYLTLYGELITPAPFESEESIWKKSHNKFSLYKKHGVEKVTIITVANQYSYEIEKIRFEALPFYEWSILNEDEDDFQDNIDL